MKRSWFGLGLLVGLLALGLWVQHYSQRLHAPILDLLKEAQTAAQTEDWDRTEKQIQQAQKLWRKHMDVRAAVCDHDYLEEIDEGFAALKVWREAQDSASTAALCAQLINQIDALAEAQKFSLRNVL